MLLKNLRFEFLPNERKIHLLTAPPLQNKHVCFGNTRYFTVPFDSRTRDDVFNVLVAYARKHDCDLAQIAVAPRELGTEVETMTLADAKQVATALRLPLVVLIDEEPEGEGSATGESALLTPLPPSAYFFDPNISSIVVESDFVGDMHKTDSNATHQ